MLSLRGIRIPGRQQGRKLSFYTRMQWHLLDNSMNESWHMRFAHNSCIELFSNVRCMRVSPEFVI